MPDPLRVKVEKSVVLVVRDFIRQEHGGAVAELVEAKWLVPVLRNRRHKAPRMAAEILVHLEVERDRGVTKLALAIDQAMRRPSRP